MLRADDFRRIGLGMDGAIERAHMGHPDFRVNGRIFATLHDDNRHGMVKLAPEQQQRFVRDHPGIFSPENGAWGRQGCTRVQLSAADEEVLGEAVTLAWQQATMLKKPRTTSTRARKRPAKNPVVRKQR